MSDAESLALAESERALVAARARAFAAALPDPVARERYERLSIAASEGAVPSELISSLELMLDLLLQRAPVDSEPLLLGVFQRTPRGQILASAVREVNAALRALRGQRLEHARVSAAPGHHSLVLETDRIRVSLAFDAHGPRVENVDAG